MCLFYTCYTNIHCFLGWPENKAFETFEYDKDHNNIKLSDIVIRNTDYDYNLWNWIPE